MADIHHEEPDEGEHGRDVRRPPVEPQDAAAEGLGYTGEEPLPVDGHRETGTGDGLIEGLGYAGEEPHPHDR